eukprot:gene15608-15757_t
MIQPSLPSCCSTDLIDLARTVDPRRGFISPRGKVSEGGANRFFRRFAEGQFDEADVKFRAQELAGFVQAQTGTKPPIALGFSNGANIAAALLYLYPDVLSGAILLRAMLPLQKELPLAQKEKSVLLISGLVDPIVPSSNAAQLARLLQQAGVTVQHEILQAGHGLTQQDLSLMQAWIGTHL